MQRVKVCGDGAEYVDSYIYRWLVNDVDPLLELVLSILVEKFVFHPGDKEIYWNMGGVANPVIKDSATNYPELPLKMIFVEEGTDNLAEGT